MMVEAAISHSSILRLMILGIGVGGKKVFGNNFIRLHDLKKRYDPNDIFGRGPQLFSQTRPE
jgi:Berberine and berberine like